MTSDESDAEQVTSQLGNKEHWDSCYATELENFHDHGDQGEIWFGVGAERRMCEFIANQDGLTRDALVLDVGCGNGSLLRRLRSLGFTSLIGVDYSAAAVQLAAEIDRNDKSAIQIRYSQCDFVRDSLTNEFDSKCAVVTDKGTFDAISLSADSDSAVNGYLSRVWRVLRAASPSIFVICSCNFTNDELIARFCDSPLPFDHVQTLPSPASMTFGGNKGSTTVICVFTKRTM